jgi:flavin-binding protein dodecin
MSKVYKYIELVGTSVNSYNEAITNAISSAKNEHHNVKWFEVTEHRGYVSNDGVAYFQAHLKVGVSPK